MDQTKDMDQCLKDLELSQDILAIEKKRILPEALSLMNRPDSRCALWWYRADTREMAFSSEARTHFQLVHFPIIKDVRGWVRGAVIEKDGLTYILVFLCDFPEGVIPGEVISNIFSLAESLFCKKINGLVDEQGRDLLINY